MGQRILLVALLAALVGCSWDAPSQTTVGPETVRVPSAQPRTAPDLAADFALGQLGIPYRYGGASPTGFDCSGLIHYSYGRAGVALPRTTGELWRTLPSVPLASLERGDVLFFDIDGKPGHVGLYVGEGQFVHAPATGRTVTTADLDQPFYRRQIVRAGRVGSR